MCESIIVVMCHVIALSDEVIIIGLLNEICISSLLLSISVLVVKSTYNWVSHYYGFNLEGYLLCYLITLYEWPFFQVFFPSLCYHIESNHFQTKILLIVGSIPVTFIQKLTTNECAYIRHHHVTVALFPHGEINLHPTFFHYKHFRLYGYLFPYLFGLYHWVFFSTFLVNSYHVISITFNQAIFNNKY